MMESTEAKKEHNDVVILELDRPYELRLSHKALKRFCSITGCSMTKLGDMIAYYDKLSLLVWVMVTQDQARNGEEMMSQEQLDDLLDAVSIAELTELVSKALEAAFGGEGKDAKKAEGEEADGENPPKAAGTGTEA